MGGGADDRVKSRASWVCDILKMFEGGVQGLETGRGCWDDHFYFTDEEAVAQKAKKGAQEHRL